MPSFRLPLSGDVTQAINPWTNVFKAFGSQFGLININLGRSAAPEIEQDILNEVGSYGRQIGRIAEVVEVLVARAEFKEPLTDDEKQALATFQSMQAEIDEIKTYHVNKANEATA